MMEEQVFIQFDGEKYPYKSELMLEDFIDIYCIVRENPSGITETTIKRMLSAVSGIPWTKVEGMNKASIDHLAELYGNLLSISMPEASWPQTIKKEEASFLLKDGETYHFQPHYGFSSLGIIRAWEDFLGDRKLDIVEHLHYIVAICARSPNERYDRSKLNDKARLVLDSLTLKQAYDPLFFFLKTRNDVLNSNSHLFKKEKKQEEGENRRRDFGPSTNKILSGWGWYHIANRMISEGKICSNMKEVDEMNMIDVFEQLSYLHDVAKVKEIERKKREQQMKLSR